MDVDRLFELLGGITSSYSMFRFRPTPFEVLQYYLSPKLRGADSLRTTLKISMCTSMIPTNSSRYVMPFILPGLSYVFINLGFLFEILSLIEYKDKGDDDRAYFFVPLTKEILQGKGNGTRTTPNGYWKIYEGNIPLYGPDGKIIGLMNKLELYSGKDPNGVLTAWKMVEYMNHRCVRCSKAAPLMVCKMKFKAREEVVVLVDDEMYEEETSSEEEEEGSNNSSK
ncbi:NAC-domain protein-like [Striga asiatica]|uniref:NAC-domain protein-like n=1 Tax=Striga asiatica TaxID=4170 RepID=A0A5A7PYJ7_STRAF|nr:NAC-domain protein-like [Striga asiatica]